MSNQRIWMEVYRPQKIEDLVLENDTKELVNKFLREKSIPHLLLNGHVGSGKTTIAKMLIKNLDCDSITLNASDERGIDVVRDKIKRFAMMSSFKNLKIVFMDEFDAMCLEENTFVKVFINNRFTDIPIKELKDKEFKVVSVNPNSGNLQLIKSKCLDTGYEEVFELELEDGRTIQCSNEHPFFKRHMRFGKQCFLERIKVKDLLVGDNIVDMQFKSNKILYACALCGLVSHTKYGLSQHIIKIHKIPPLDYYLKYCSFGVSGKCKVCGKLTKFISIGHGFKKYCSKSCQASYAGKVSGQTNFRRGKKITEIYSDVAVKNSQLRNRRTYLEKYGESRSKSIINKQNESRGIFYKTEVGQKLKKSAAVKQSIKMKKHIQSGRFTPCVTNSFTHRSAKLIVDGITYSFRSTWEKKFFSTMLSFGYNALDLGYEQVRLPYIYQGNKHVYIVDFYVEKYGWLIEIKPKCRLNDSREVVKFDALKEYALKNNYKYSIFTEDFIQDINFVNKLQEYIRGLH